MRQRLAVVVACGSAATAYASSHVRTRQAINKHRFCANHVKRRRRFIECALLISSVSMKRDIRYFQTRGVTTSPTDASDAGGQCWRTCMTQTREVRGRAIRASADHAVAGTGWNRTAKTMRLRSTGSPDRPSAERSMETGLPVRGRFKGLGKHLPSTTSAATNVYLRSGVVYAESRSRILGDGTGAAAQRGQVSSCGKANQEWLLSRMHGTSGQDPTWYSPQEPMRGLQCGPC